MDYWKECIAEAFEDAGIAATDEQINTVASWAEGAYDSYGMAHGHDRIPNPLQSKNEELQRELNKERSKENCRTCDGRGRIITPGPYHSSNSQCWKCNGEGRVSP